MGIFYLGAFPPSYGGVTIKNQNLFDALSEKIEIEKVDFNKIKRKDLTETCKLMKAIGGKNNRFVIGVSGKKTRKRLTQILYYFNRRSMKKSVIMLMGGLAAKDIAEDLEYQKCASAYKKIYVETYGMGEVLKNAGLDNVDYYPNGRFRSLVMRKINDNSIEKLKCIFFSKIQKEKGVDIIIKAAEKIPEVEFCFYGELSMDYKDEFLSLVSSIENIDYKGVFSGNSEEVYSLLSRYDVLLLPTRWKAEGVPGILVESKIAGITAIVSDHNYNADIIEDGREGLIMKNYSAEELISLIRELERDREFLLQLKVENQKSADKFYIDSYIDKIVDIIMG